MPERLHKSQRHRMVAGVAGGLADYFDVDPTFVRLAFVLLAFWHGIGVLAYVILWIVMPEEGSPERAPSEVVRENLDRLRQEADRLTEGIRGEHGEPGVQSAETAGEATAGTTEVVTYTPPRPASNRQVVAGAILVLVGVILLVENLNLLWWLNLGRLWPLALIAIGAFLLYDRGRRR